MENKNTHHQEKVKENIEEDIKGSDADIDRGITDGEFAEIGKKQAGKDNTEDEIKGSDADRAI